jgi:hypothetical protein
MSSVLFKTKSSIKNNTSGTSNFATFSIQKMDLKLSTECSTFLVLKKKIFWFSFLVDWLLLNSYLKYIENELLGSPDRNFLVYVPTKLVEISYTLKRLYQAQSSTLQKCAFYKNKFKICNKKEKLSKSLLLVIS